jgi:hypothetical protein
MPKRWLSQCDQFDLSVKLNWSGSYDELGYDKGDQMYVGRVALKSKPYLPPDARGYSPTLYFGFKEDEPIPAEIADAVNYMRKCHEIEARWDKVEVQVRDFLDNCKSLNEALKLWPDLSVYIPKHYIERVEKKANRSTTETKSSAEEVLAKINTQEIQAAAVIARLSGA